MRIRHAVVEGLEQRDFVGVGFDEIGQLEQQARALRGRHRRPRRRLEGLACRLDRHVDVRFPTRGRAREHAFVGGIDHLEGLTALRGLPAPGDEQLARAGR